MLDRRARTTALCRQIFSSIGARRRDFEPLLVFEILLAPQRYQGPETMLNRSALATTLCMQIFSSIGARRCDFEPLLVFGTVFRLRFPVNPVNPVNGFSG